MTRGNPVIGEMVTGIDVEILRGHHMAVLGPVGQVRAYSARQGRPTRHRE